MLTPSPDVMTMTAELVLPNPARPILHSQLVLPKRQILQSLLLELESESHWVRVNRICDQYFQDGVVPAK